VLVTYDDAYQRFMVRNSLGKSWGMSGNFTIPYTYLTNPNLSDDFWAIKSVS
jgi:C1A family cysteine protease